MKEKHVTILEEPGTKYLGYVTSSSAINLSNLSCLCCKGCTMNTGKHTEAIRRMKEKLQRQLKEIIFHLYSNELPLHHLLGKINWNTSGSHAFTGLVVKNLYTCHSLSIAVFEPIDCNLEKLFPKIEDEAQTRNTCWTFANLFHRVLGKGANNRPGKLFHAVWLTTSNRVIRLYIRTDCLSQSLRSLTKYVIQVYAPG